jgi:lysophospholipase-1/lysophospholipase-2
MPGISIPARAQHTASVIFAHGLGDSGAGWSFLPELMAAQNLLPGVKWILPNAPFQRIRFSFQIQQLIC